MKQDLVIAGIGTEVGKTVVSALFVEAMKADYWKPVQSGSLTDSDTRTVKELISNAESEFHDEAYLLKEPLSPHAAAKIDGVEIALSAIQIPDTENDLVIELAGGLMVPLNDTALNMDLLEQWKLPVVIVSDYYLGSINHTLLTIDALKSRHIPVHSIVFNGTLVEESRNAIIGFSGIDQVIEIPRLETLNSENIKVHAQRIAAQI